MLILVPAKKKNTLKSGKLKTADSLVLHPVVWQHQMLYTMVGQLAVYEDISILLFVIGYMQVLEAEKLAIRPLMDEYLEELMGCAELYGWEPVVYSIWSGYSS